MEMYGNEISVQQGEDWNLDLLLSSNQVEYIPFIISSERSNPFFVVTIASTKYEKQLRYVKSWWNDAQTADPVTGQEPIPTFYQTVPYDLGNFKDFEDFEKTCPISQPPMIKGSQEDYETRLLYQYTLDTDEIDEETGHKPYHYCYYRYKEIVIPDDIDSMLIQRVVDQRIDEYACYIRFNFSSTETEQWGSQNYMYQITLVSGELLEDTLYKIAIENGMPDDWPESTEAQYRYVKIQWPDALQTDIDVTSPLGRIDSPQVIVPPTKLQVFNNLRKII